MKPKSFLLPAFFLMLFVIPEARGQNYQALTSSRVSFYQADHSSWNYQLEENILGIKTDSTVALPSGDSIFYFYRMMRDTGNLYFGDCILDTMAPCWMGSHAIIKPNGDNIFFNREGDTIRIKTQAGLGESWVFQRRPGFFYRATLDSLIYSSLPGKEDSVKVISLQAFSNAGTPIPDWFNQKTIRLSKNHGFAVLYSFYDFPADTNRYHSFDYEPLTIGSVYDFNVGDVFHFKFGSNLAGPPQYKVITILTKWFSAGNDTIFYRQKEINYINALVWDPDPHVVSSTETDTVTVFYANPDSLLSAVLPHQKGCGSVWNVSYYTLFAQPENLNNRPAMTFDYSSTHMFDAGLNCYKAAFEPTYDYHSFTKGCGASYTYHEEPADLSGFYNKLVYYVKGTETWGDPYIFDAVNEIPKEEVLIEVFPNPFSNQIEIRLETKTHGRVSLCLYSLTGVLLQKMEDSFKQAGIYTYHPDLLSFSKGVYILKYSTGQNIAYKKLIRN
ncbi:MAG: T9SS type A sorting domain-containing protein [Bacteroidota bacterium]